MAATIKKTPAPAPVKKGSGDYLLRAWEDLDRARERAQQEARRRIDSHGRKRRLNV
jgi:hypothetical protein